MKKLIVLVILLVGVSFQNVYAQEALDVSNEEEIADEIESVDFGELNELVPEHQATEQAIEEGSHELTESKIEANELHQEDLRSKNMAEESTVTPEFVEDQISEDLEENVEFDTSEDTSSSPSDVQLETTKITTMNISINSGADALYTSAINGSTASERLALFIEGYQLYPNDLRFETGINDSARSLYNWARSQQNQGQFETAIDRYETILSAPALTNSLRNSVELSLQEAKNSPDYLFKEASSQATASERLELFIKGYLLYPNDTRFTSGINTSASSLLNWAREQHQRGSYSIAIDRYEYILSAPGLDYSLKREAEIRLDYAKRSNKVPGSSVLLNEAGSKATASERLEAYVDGYYLYSSSSDFVSGINSSARSLFTWTRLQHEEGNYEIAVERYRFILSAPGVQSSTRKDTETNLSYAEKGIRTPSMHYSYASKRPTASERLESFVEGYNLFSQDKQFVEGIHSSARSLLNWTKEQHQRENFDTAIERYQYILSAPVVNKAIEEEIVVRLKFAEKGEKTPNANQFYELSRTGTTASQRLEMFLDGYVLYPNDSRFSKGINDSAQSLLNWAKEQHQKSSFATAIDRYNTILAVSQIAKSIRDEASSNLALAEKGLTLDKRSIIYTTYNSTLTEALSKQMALTGSPPQTDKYANANVFIHSSLLSITESAAINCNCNGVNIRTSPNNVNNSNVVFSLNSGTAITILDEVTGSSVGGSTKWYNIEYDGNRNLYVHSSLVSQTGIATVTSTANIRQSASTNSHSFGTVSSGTKLTIVARHTGTTVGNSNVWYELQLNRAWRNATSSDVLEFIDPDINKKDMFQHLVLSHSVDLTEDHINDYINGKGTLSGLGKAFKEAGEKYSVNQAYLVAHAILETGHGRSTLAQGVYVDKDGNVYRDSNGNLILDKSKLPADAVKVFNMFGIAAVDSNPTNGGARYAFEQGWTTPAKAIEGGAKWISENYINSKTHDQNTVYKMRWNPANPATHQYATDIGWAFKQVNIIKALYDKLNNPTLRFDIVQYR